MNDVYLQQNLQAVNQRTTKKFCRT